MSHAIAGLCCGVYDGVSRPGFYNALVIAFPALMCILRVPYLGGDSQASCMCLSFRFTPYE